MAGVVLRAASVGSGSGAGDIDIVSIAEAGTKLAEIALQEAEKLKEQARNDNNESNIRKQFLENAISSLRTATFDQYNIVICTDHEHDEFQDLQGQILLLRPIDVEVKKDTLVNFKVYIFDTGIYVRYGKRGREDWSWWGESKERIDSVAMQVYFENAQPKKNAEDINALMDKGGAQNAATAADAQADATTKQAEEDSAAANDGTLKAEAENEYKEGHQTENGDEKPGKAKGEQDVGEVSDDEEEPCDDMDEESDDKEEKGSEDEDAQSEDLREN